MSFTNATRCNSILMYYRSSEVCFSENVTLSVRALDRLRRQQEFAIAHSATFATLTRREREVLTAWAEGHSNRDIASEEFVSPHTVRTHRQNIRAKLGIHHVVEAVWWGQCFDLV